MGNLVQWYLLAAIIGMALAYERSSSADASDITSINNLKDRNGIETIILRVLKKISDSGSLPEDFPHADYLRLLSAHQAESEDLGSLELSGEQTKTNEFMAKNDGEFGKKLAESSQQETKEIRKDVETSDFERHYISPKNSDKNSSTQNNTKSPLEVSMETTPESNIALEDDNSQSEIGYKEEFQTEETSELLEATTVLPEVQSRSNEQASDSEFDGYRYETVQNVQDSEKSGNTAILHYMSSENGNYAAREGKKNNADGNDYQIGTPLKTESELEKNEPDANVVSDEISNGEKNEKFSVEYEYMHSAFDSNLVPTKPTPDNEIILMGPTPIDIPDAQYEEDDSTTPTRVSSINITPKLEENGNEEKKNKYENVRHTVEFAASPLVAAFTVQQDDKGIPRKIVPLDYDHPTPAPAPTENPEIVAQRQRELEEQEFILYQQLKSLQEEKYRYITPQQRQQQLQLLRRQEELKRQQLNLHMQQQGESQRQEKGQQNLYPSHNYYNQNYLHNTEYVQKEHLRHRGYAGQLEYVAHQEVEHPKQPHYRYNALPYQGIEFHKSVDYSLPQYEHNRVHRREPVNYVGNLGYSKPLSVSGQIQNLITSSGISSRLPSNTQTDLNVVSKILALNHGASEGASHPLYRRSYKYISY